MYIRRRRRTRSLIAITAAAAAAAAVPIVARLPVDAQAETRSLCYPIEGQPLGAPTFGDPRGGGRTHAGHDIMGPKMVPLQAAAAGVVEEVLYDNGSGNRLAIRDSDGWRYVYLHLNNDTPGTDDGAATRAQVFAPGIEVGAVVHAGQVVAYNGDSGNAEASGAHLHFEIRRPRSGHWSLASPIDPYASLQAAVNCSISSPPEPGDPAPPADPAHVDHADRTQPADPAPPIEPTESYGPFESARALVERQYRDILGRSADTAGRDFWVGRVQSGLTPPHGVATALLGSPEAGRRTAPVARLYWAFFLRIPDQSGLAHWLHEYRDGVPLADIAQAFSASAEFRSRYASPADAAFVDLVYRNALGRAPDAGGRAYWTGQLSSGARTWGQVMLQFSESPEYIARMATSVSVTTAYVGMLGRAPDPGGLANWVTQGTDALARGIFVSSEYSQRLRRS